MNKHGSIWKQAKNMLGKAINNVFKARASKIKAR